MRAIPDSGSVDGCVITVDDIQWTGKFIPRAKITATVQNAQVKTQMTQAMDRNLTPYIMLHMDALLGGSASYKSPQDELPETLVYDIVGYTPYELAPPTTSSSLLL